MCPDRKELGASNSESLAEKPAWVSEIMGYWTGVCFRIPAPDFGKSAYMLGNFYDIFTQYVALAIGTSTKNQREQMVEHNKQLLQLLTKLGWEDAEDFDPENLD